MEGNFDFSMADRLVPHAIVVEELYGYVGVFWGWRIASFSRRDYKI